MGFVGKQINILIDRKSSQVTYIHEEGIPFTQVPLRDRETGEIFLDVDGLVAEDDSRVIGIVVRKGPMSMSEL